MKPIDLRSDTVTLPTLEMRQAIFEAELGDDVMGEDSTVNRLETMAAERLGKEAGLLAVSGTMSNLIAVLSHCQRGDEFIVGTEAHILLYEAGGSAGLGGVHHRAVPNEPDGTMNLLAIEEAIREPNIHFPRTALICLENTHNRCGGDALTPEYTASVVDLARRYAIPLHLDGARIFNAAVALGVDVKELTKGVESVGFCLSKGLSAPVGSVLCGSEAFIARARRLRKMLGGGMRQAGIIAAAGIVGLEKMIDRLAEDHANARRLAEGIQGIASIQVDPEQVSTNIIIAEVVEGSAVDLQTKLAAAGVKASIMGKNNLRFVTHNGIDRTDILAAIAIINETLA
ncbi:MAG: low-specificity L-threonine aldolase [Dehalococcoidia bacterium]|nr:low-specificity L-threonine aldolase [Dehalococcoidia bacterium]